MVTKRMADEAETAPETADAAPSAPETPIPGPTAPIRVRALSNVLGLVHGDETELYPTPRVERLISAGHLVWLDDPDA